MANCFGLPAAISGICDRLCGLWGFATGTGVWPRGAPCFGDTLRMQSPAFCLLARNYVSPELEDVAQEAAKKVAQQYPRLLKPGWRVSVSGWIANAAFVA